MSNESELAMRIAQLVEYKTGGKQTAFAELMGWSKQYLSKLLNGESIGINTISTIVSVMPEVNARWLLTGVGNMVDAAFMVNVVKLWCDYEEYIPVMNEADKAAIGNGIRPETERVLEWGKLLRERTANIQGRIEKAMERQKNRAALENSSKA